MSLLEVYGLKTYFYTRRGVAKVLDGLDFTLESGQIVGLVGETGSGKSLMGFSILRLVRRPGRIVDGTILFEGRDLLKLPESQMAALRGRDIAMIFQNPRTALNPLITVGRFLEQVLHFRGGLPRKRTRDEAVRLLSAVHIPDPERCFSSYPHQLSGGMAQRVMIAAAIAARPKLLIADEPTTGLDVTVQAQIMRLLRELREETGAAQILITHDLGLALEVCDAIAVMYAGEIVEFASTRKLLAIPRHPYTKGLLASRPKLGQTGELPVIPGAVTDFLNSPPGCRFSPRCPYAFARCQLERPKPVYISPDHYAACFLLEEGGHA
jgi:oligopeptide/dipeptide ABC transporter ATP-binding protein